MRRSSWVLVTVFLLFVSMLGIWCMDVGASAMAADGGPNLYAVATNGFWARAPLQQYHIGLVMTIVSMLALTFIAIRSIMDNLFIFEERGGL